MLRYGNRILFNSHPLQPVLNCSLNELLSFDNFMYNLSWEKMANQILSVFIRIYNKNFIMIKIFSI